MIETAKRLSATEEYYFSTKLRQLDRLRDRGVDVINMGVGIPDLAPPDPAVTSLIASSRIAENHGYQPYRGSSVLREAIAAWYSSRFDVEIDASCEVLPLMGSKEAIAHISLAFLDPGDRVLVPNPGYPVYSSAASLVGAETVYYDLTERSQWLPDLDQLHRLDYTKIKLMWINYPHMPTGAVPTANLFRDLLDLAAKKCFLLCHDNPYSLLVNDRPMSILQYDVSKGNSLELNSLSKSHNISGWRFGMAIGNHEAISAVAKVKSVFDSGMFRGIQEGAMAAMRMTLEWHQQNNANYDRRRKLVERFLAAIDCFCPAKQVGMFAWARLPESARSAEDFVDQLLSSTGIFLTPGTVFGSNGERFVRASLCLPDERIKECLARVNTRSTEDQTVHNITQVSVKRA